MQFAQVEKATGLVVNVVVAEAPPVADSSHTFVEYSTPPAWVGLHWTAATGFEQPPAEQHWANDYLPPEAAPDITPAEFEAILKEHEAAANG